MSSYKPVILLLSFIMFFIYNIFSIEQTQVFKSCIVNANLYYPEAMLELTIDITANNASHTGVIRMSGIYKSNKLKRSIRRDIYFSLIKYDDNYLYSSYLIDKFKAIDNMDDELLSNMLPIFFIYEKNSISYTVKRQKNNGYMFLNSGRPIFFCAVN
ncbi:hypothetical protein NJ17_004354 [Salmonella enterica subsp. enterica]|nr:hypothetical protein [Salmonella enterica subsp. enterica]